MSTCTRKVYIYFLAKEWWFGFICFKQISIIIHSVFNFSIAPLLCDYLLSLKKIWMTVRDAHPKHWLKRHWLSTYHSYLHQPDSHNHPHHYSEEAEANTLWCCHMGNIQGGMWSHVQNHDLPKCHEQLIKTKKRIHFFKKRLWTFQNC